MSFFSAFFFIFAVFLVIIFVLVLLLRKAKYGSALGSLASTFYGGIPIIDKAGTGNIAEVMGYEQHPVTGKIRLRINFPDLFREGQTPFVFDPEDFNPSLERIDWEHYTGNIICYWDFERRKDFRDNATYALTYQVSQLKKANAITWRMGKDLLEFLEKEKIDKSKESDNLYRAKALKVLKSIVQETNVDNVTPSDMDSDGGMFE